MSVQPLTTHARRAAGPIPIEPSSWFTAVVAIGIVAVGLLAEHVGGTWHDPPYIPILDLATGWLFAACGLISVATRPGQPAGRRLILAGLVWFVGTVGGSDPSLDESLGFAFGGYHDLVP
jgi:hypothetical protein